MFVRAPACNRERLKASGGGQGTQRSTVPKLKMGNTAAGAQRLERTASVVVRGGVAASRTLVGRLGVVVGLERFEGKERACFVH
jgi:hypothetical protein